MALDTENLGREELQEKLMQAQNNLRDLESRMQRDLRSAHPNLHRPIRRAYGSKILSSKEEISAYRAALNSDSIKETREPRTFDLCDRSFENREAIMEAARKRDILVGDFFDLGDYVEVVVEPFVGKGGKAPTFRTVAIDSAGQKVCETYHDALEGFMARGYGSVCSPEEETKYAEWFSKLEEMRE